MSCLRVMWYNTLWFLVVTPWWYHDVVTLSTLLVFVWGRWTSLTKGLLIRASGIYLAVSINNLWNKQSTHHWFQTPGRSYHCNVFRSWWRHQMEFSALLAICAGNSPATGEFPHKGQWRGALMFFLICTWNGWVNNRAAGDLRRHRAHYDVTVMWITGSGLIFICSSIDLCSVPSHKLLNSPVEMPQVTSNVTVTCCRGVWIPYYNDQINDDVIKWKYLPRYWPFVRGIHRWPVNSSQKGQWLGALMFSLICAWTNGWINNRDAGDMRRHRPHYDVTGWMCKECRRCGRVLSWHGQNGYWMNCEYDECSKWKGHTRVHHRASVNIWW